MNSLGRKLKTKLDTTMFALPMLTLVTVFVAIVIPVQAQTVTTLHNFNNASGGGFPQGALAQGRDGNYYGVTYVGGGGTVFKISASGTYTLLHSFRSDQSEGVNCNGLALGSDGNFYGTCYQGGNNANSTGTLFKVTPTGTLTVLHYFDGTFSNTTDGCYPRGVPVQASDGNFYGTTQECGLHNGGIAYKLTPAGVFSIISAFAGSPGPSQPQGTLIQGSDGNLWGTTYQGGQNGSGTVFKMTTGGTVTVVYQFASCGTGTTGCDPIAGLVQGPDGNYYGTTQTGGANNEGAVFRVTPAGAYTLLHSFNVTTDKGAIPIEPLALGADGNFYGVATDCFGGGCSPADLFKVTPKGAFTDVYNFPDLGGNNNSDPNSPLLLSTNGTFYGTTFEGGTTSSGTFYSLSTAFKPFVSLLPTNGIETAKIGILGQGFSASSVVKFGGVTATTKALTGSTFILATVPAGALTGNVTVTTGTTTLTSNQIFKVKPTLKTFTPSSGPVGTVVTITGTGLKQATLVKFNGTSASFTVNSDTQITTMVPAGATTGKIAVFTKGGSIASATNFTVN